jgi:acetyl-CoA C-acetyltransferase
MVQAVRTAIGNFGGSLRNVKAYDLSARVMNEIVGRSHIKPDDVDMVIMGQNYQSGEYVNIARMSLLKADWPVETTGLTIDRRCPSGLDAICVANMLIQTGQIDVAVAGGVESMSTAEFYLTGDIRWSLGGTGDMPRGHGSMSTWGLPLFDRIQRARVMSQPPDRFGTIPSMMVWAESAAAEHKISREEADAWAFLSHQRACQAIENDRFKDEIVPLSIPEYQNGHTVFDTDERPRPGTTPAALAKLKPVMKGVCTAGNSSGENDGAALCLLMDKRKTEKLGIKGLARLKSFAFKGVDPRFAWKSATESMKSALEKAGLAIEQMDLIEIHEAFAAQTLANIRELKLTEKDYDRINVNGSCIALGHPLGATGARILTTLLYEMRRRRLQYGLIGICGGGGMGVGAVIENLG